jgi:VIT1/CCC1 family predicted Fe2+/Mn2+ transporter
MSGTWQRVQDWLTVIIGVLLFIAPFALGATANQAAAWTAYAGGVLLAIAGLWRILNTTSSPANHFPEWAEIVIGVLVFLAPWALGFTGLTAMAWSAWIAGLLVVVLAGSVVLNERGSEQLVGQR